MDTVIPTKRWVYIIPIAMGMYVFSFVDRVNIAMIFPYMLDSLGLTAGDASFAAGIFFVGYMILQIPGGLLASRWSAKKVVAILMVAWGITSVATGFVQNANQLYIARLLLGLFEGGVWPAALVLLANWFPQRERARANALWMTCLPIGTVFMTPLTGWLLTLMNWRAVMIIEGLPPLLWVVVWWFFIADRPSEAHWVSPAERQYVETSLAAENAAKAPSSGYWAAFTDSTVLLLIVAYFFWMAGFYGFTMWVPTVVKGFAGDHSSTFVGLISAVPFVFAAVSMLVVSTLSDRLMKRQAFAAVPAVIGACGLIAGQFVHTPALQLSCLILAAIGVYGPYGPFWAVPSAILRAEVAGGAMGFINAIGNLGGFLGPMVVGYMRVQTGSNFAGFLILSVFLLIFAAIMMMIRSDQRCAKVHAFKPGGGVLPRPSASA